MEKLLPRINLSEAKAAVVNPAYEEVLTRLVSSAEDGIIAFNGGPLDLDNERPAWLRPVEVHSDRGSQFYHLIYLNSTPDTFHSDSRVDVVLLDETAIKLADTNSDIFRYYQDASNSSEPRMIIRPVQIGMMYFRSLISADIPTPDYLQDSLRKLIGKLGVTASNFYDFRIKKSPSLERDYGQGIAVASETDYDTPFGKVTVSDIVVEDDDWRYYQLIRKSSEDTSVPEHASLRIDSGCDSGQIYLDRGCDCREQLHEALKDVVQNGKIVIHAPTQDGRGYGTAVKMETEGIKRGVPMIFNGDNPVPLNTIQAAQVLFGDNFDLRTYDGVGRILHALGYKRITLQTNNKIKISGLENAGLVVTRVPAITVEKHPESGHAQSKKNYSRMYFKE